MTKPTDLGLLLARGYQEFVVNLRLTLEHQGFDDLGRSDGFVFRALASHPASVSELAARLGVSKQAAAQVIDDMERRGYVTRNVDSNDARSRLVELSDRGRRALTAASAFHQEYEKQLTELHGPSALMAVRAVLTSMSGGPASVLDPNLRALYL